MENLQENSNNLLFKQTSLFWNTNCNAAYCLEGWRWFDSYPSPDTKQNIPVQGLNNVIKKIQFKKCLLVNTS